MKVKKECEYCNGSKLLSLGDGMYQDCHACDYPNVDKRTELIEELKRDYIPESTNGKNLLAGCLADFILARDKKNAEPLVKLNHSYVFNESDYRIEFDKRVKAIDATLTNLGVESKEK